MRKVIDKNDYVFGRSQYPQPLSFAPVSGVVRTFAGTRSDPIGDPEQRSCRFPIRSGGILAPPFKKKPGI